MAYSKNKVFEKAKEIVEVFECIYIQDVIDLMGCPRKTTFYKLFPEGSEKLNVIKDAIARNRAINRVEARKTLKTSKNSTDRAIWYKLNALKEELDALNNKTITVNTTDDETAPIKVAFGDA